MGVRHKKSVRSTDGAGSGETTGEKKTKEGPRPWYAVDGPYLRGKRLRKGRGYGVQ